MKTCLTFTLMLFSIMSFSQNLLTSSTSLKVALRPQKYSKWCWAASEQMIAEYLNKQSNQCESANSFFNRTICCNDPAPKLCDRGGWPDFSKYGYLCDITDHAGLSWDKIREEISVRQKPIAFSWLWKDGNGELDGTGHMMVIYGFTVVNGTRYVSIHNPWPVDSGDTNIFSYEYYLEGADHVHWNDYYGFRVAPIESRIASLTVNSNSQNQVPGNQKTELSNAMNETNSIAKKSLDTYTQLTAQKEGPGSDRAPAKLGNPFPVVFIGLNELRQTDNFDSLLSIHNNTHTIMYPIRRAGDTRSGVVLQKSSKNGEWKEVSFGGELVTNLLVETREKFANILKKSISDFYTVTIPSFNLNLIAVKIDDETKLIPIINDHSLNIKAGQVITAKDFGKRLYDAAKDYQQPLPK